MLAIAVLIAALIFAVMEAIFWKLCCHGVLLYFAKCGNPLPDWNLIEKYVKKVVMKTLHIKED